MNYGPLQLRAALLWLYDMPDLVRELVAELNAWPEDKALWEMKDLIKWKEAKRVQDRNFCSDVFNRHGYPLVGLVNAATTMKGPPGHSTRALRSESIEPSEASHD